MTNRKRHVEIWPFASIQFTPISTVAGFNMPDCTMLHIEYGMSDVECRAAQFKARATARAIVRAEYPQAFAGLKA